MQLTRNSLTGAAANFLPDPYFQGGVSGGFPANVFTLDVPPAFRGITQNFRNPMVQKWNAAVQHDFGHSLALEVSYVGNHQSHGVEIWDPNACPNNPSGTYNCDANRPIPALGGLSFVDAFGFGNYHGLTSKLEKRYSSGVTFTSSYTWGHALADTGTTLTGSPNQGSKDRRNLSGGYSSAAWDIRHSWVTSLLYDLPVGKGKKYLNGGGLSNWVLGGWQFNTIATFRTGAPYTLGTNQCVGTFGTCQPDLVPGKDPGNAPSGGRRPGEWFDISAVTNPTPGTPGTLGLQTETRPGQRNVDVSLFKSIPFTERYRVQFRAEAFNIANTPQWGLPNATQGDPNFGIITSTQANTQRHVQFSLRFLF